MAVNTIGNSNGPIGVDELGIGVTPVWGARSLSALNAIDYSFSTGLSVTGGTVSIVVSEIDHDSLLNFEENEHIDWTNTDEELVTSGDITGDTLLATAEIYTDNIVEYTSDEGVTIDGVLIKDNSIDASYISGLSANTLSSDIVVSLSGGKTFGKYTNGQTIPATGKTPEEVLTDIAQEYITPSFTSFSASGATQVEVGTTISGDYDFTWSTNEGSGSIPQVTIIDVTIGDAALGDAENILNDGSENNVTVNTNTLAASGDKQQWKITGEDSVPTPPVSYSSSNHTITAYYYRYYGPTSSAPASKADLQALGGSAFQTSNSQSFSFETGTTESIFVIALPPGRTLASVNDEDSLGADYTDEFTLSTLTIQDADGENAVYNIYTMTIVGTFDPSHTLNVVTA